jgi:GntR family transcriptional repressor for pyruvate dehydrogenase complex
VVDREPSLTQAEPGLACATSALASQQAVDALQRRISTGELKEGVRLPSQRELSRDLGVSRATLREALSVLETLGLVQVAPRKGVFVGTAKDGAGTRRTRWRFAARYSEQEVFELRYTLETSAARFAALSSDRDHVEKLAETITRMKEAGKDRDAAQYANSDFDFHHLIIQTAGNRLLADLHAGIRPLVIETQRLPLYHPAEFWEPIREHERILDALRLQDPDGAAYLMQMHLTRAAGRSGTSFRL